MYERAELMVELGCVHALNFDGKGSSTLIHEGSIKILPMGTKMKVPNKRLFVRHLMHLWFAPTVVKRVVKLLKLLYIIDCKYVVLADL